MYLLGVVDFLFYLFTYLFFYLFIYLSTYLFIYSFTYLFIYLLIYLFIYLFAHNLKVVCKIKGIFLEKKLLLFKI